MKKEFYKLSFVFIMIVFSFSLAFFLGREMTLKKTRERKESPKTFANNKKAYHNLLEEPRKQSLKELTKQSQREKVKIYKKAIADKNSLDDKKAIADKNSLKNKALGEEALLSQSEVLNKEATLKKDIPKKIDTLYTLLIAKYEQKKPAIEKSTELKIKFPHWEIFFKKFKDSYKVYIGPFKSKEYAENFLKELKEKPDFSHVTLEKLN